MKKTYLPALIAILVIGFAAVSTTLLINGTINFGFNEDEFVVKFTKAIIDGVDKSSEVIDENGKSLTFTTKELSMLEEESRLDFQVTNTSSQYDATVTMECTVEGTHKDYYTITKDMPTEIKAKRFEKGNVVAKLKKVITESVSDDITCTLTVNAVERTDLAVEPTYINNTLLTKVNDSVNESYETGNKHEMFKFEHEATDQTPELTEYRYIGSDPYNYIEFNDETWRIIGMFDVDGEERLKIIKDEKLAEDKNWGYEEYPLVNNYLASGGIHEYLNGVYKASLTEDAKNQIVTSTYYLGALSNFFDGIGATYAYIDERGVRNCADGQGFANCNGERELSTKSDIELMYPSDYMASFEYSSNNYCYEYGMCSDVESWLELDEEEWTISSDADSRNNAISIDHSSKQISRYSTIDEHHAIRPVLYLKDKVEFVDGSGKQDDPYIIH